VTRRTIVFDVGGVLVRWQPLELMRQVLPQQAYDDASAKAVVAAVFEAFGPGADWSEFDRGRIDADTVATRIAARTGYPLQGLRALVEAIPEHIQPVPAGVALLERVRAVGHRLALLSNMPIAYAEHLEATHACFAWFEARVFSGRVGLIKPERAMFDHARDALALDLNHSLFIDDHAGNIDVARNCGWQALHFEGAAQCEAALRHDGWL
jgi:putative hydrolase of the HAD superfamily